MFGRFGRLNTGIFGAFGDLGFVADTFLTALECDMKSPYQR